MSVEGKSLDRFLEKKCPCRYTEEEGLGGPSSSENAAVSTCDSKSLSSHFATMRESAKIKTQMPSVTERKDQSKPGPGGCHQAPETTSLKRPHFRNHSDTV